MCLCGVRRGARRECDERVGSVRNRIVKIRRFEIFTAGKTDAAAADSAADLCISLALIAILVMRQRLLRALGLFGPDVRNAMRQAAHLREQQGKDQQQSGEQGAMHGGTLTKCPLNVNEHQPCIIHFPACPTE